MKNTIAKTIIGALILGLFLTGLYGAFKLVFWVLLQMLKNPLETIICGIVFLTVWWSLLKAYDQWIKK
jgi:hypothetical protein